MKATLVDDWSELDSLEADWNALLQRSRANTIFLTWEWIRAWLDVTQHRHEPCVVIVRDRDDRLCGIAPFYVATYRLARLLPLRVLRVAGDAPTGAEYPDWIVDGDREQAVEVALVEALRANTRAWDGIWMPNVADWSGAPHNFVDAFRTSGCHARTRRVPFCRIELPDSLDAYERRLSRGRREQIRRKCRRVLGRSDVSVTRCQTREQVDVYLEALFDLHRRRWRQRGEEGSFRRRPELARFYRRFVPVALANGWLRLFALEQGGAIRAVQLGYAYNGVFYQIQEGFDPDSEAGVGNVLRYKVIETCIEEGLGSYDFMAGESEHKRRWSAETRTGHDIFVGRRGLVTNALFTAGVWPTGRYLKPARARRHPPASPAGEPAAQRGPNGPVHGTGRAVESERKARNFGC